ncbi:HAD hydrolase-like protein [Hungatella sp.]|uniref:HAD hydrolase-like protein n=1 Tax=Hungatella sp. TaxID=2613924 RepID=UPI003991E726
MDLKRQMKRSLAACGDTDGARATRRSIPVYMEMFGKYCNYEMHPYDGIVELTSKAEELGLKIAVVSNKPDAQAEEDQQNMYSARDILTR